MPNSSGIRIVRQLVANASEVMHISIGGFDEIGCRNTLAVSELPALCHPIRHLYCLAIIAACKGATSTYSARDVVLVDSRLELAINKWRVLKAGSWIDQKIRGGQRL